MTKTAQPKPKKKYRVFHEDDYEITVLEQGTRYSIRVRMPPDDEHEKWYYSKTRRIEAKSKSEAVVACEQYKQELERGEEEPPMTLADYADAFQENRRALSKVAKLTLDRDEIDINRIKKYLGDATLVELDAPTIEKAYVRMTKDGVSKDSLHKAHMKLKQVMRKACNEGLINCNPCDAVEGITRPKQDPAKKKEHRITTQEALRLAQELRNEEKTGKIVAVWLALAPGIRRGEALALVWDDIDLKGKRLHIRRQFGKEKALKEPKMVKSRRTIATDDETVAFLSEWRRKQSEEFAAVGIGQSGHSPVCSNEVCKFTDPDTFSRWRRSFYVKHGLAHYVKEEKWIDSRGIERVKRSGYVGPNFHALRHAQATLLVAGGVDPKTVQARLGHEKITTTLEIYAEAEEAGDVKAAEYLNGLLGGTAQIQ